MSNDAPPAGPDLSRGIPVGDLADGTMLLGHFGEESVLLARRGAEIFAVAATCTHYGGPLAEGMMVGDTVRCPWHHACFALRTGAAVRAPALNDLACWRVERSEGRIIVREKISAPAAKALRAPDRRVVIVGAGAAGNAAAEMLRREGFGGSIIVIDPDADAPYDRPNLSKDYLAGNAPEDWIPLHPRSFYEDHRIELRLGRRVTAIDTAARRVTLDDDAALGWDALLLATGASPVKLPKTVDAGGRVRYLRTLADSRAIIAAAAKEKRVVIIGASFIGLETAAALRARGVAVDVVAPEARPLERVLGPELGDFVRTVHESHGVRFHLGVNVTSVGDRDVTLSSGERLAADLVIAGIGVRPNLELAERAGLTVDKGVVVDEFLETSAAGIYAAGDIARWPDPRSDGRIRVEHWVVAERQGQSVARNILASFENVGRTPFTDVPFFWSQHYDLSFNYVGHAERWDSIAIDGSLDAHDCSARLIAAGRTLAVVTLFRDHESLEAELAMERDAAPRKP